MNTASMARRRVRPPVVTLGVVAATLLIVPLSARAQIDMVQSQRAPDGTVYQVARVTSSLLAGADALRITQVAGSTFDVQHCSEVAGGSGSLVTAATGVNPAGAETVHPYAEILRTGILNLGTPSVVSFTAGASGAGRLVFGTGSSAREVCRTATDCVGGIEDLPVFPLSSDQGGIPPACIAQQVPSSCADPDIWSTFAFGTSLNPSPPDDNGNVFCTNLPTTNTTVCGPAPIDGFTLTPGQAIVFVYDGGLLGAGFDYGVAGFGIDVDGVNVPGCPLAAAGTIILGLAQSASSVPPPPPTLTPTGTITPTPAVTPTPGCPGDCNGDGEVGVAELVRGVNIILGTMPLSTCPSFDRDGDGAVAIGEVVQAVNALLTGCA